MLSGEKQEELKQATKSLKEMYSKIDQYYVKRIRESVVLNIIFVGCAEKT